METKKVRMRTYSVFVCESQPVVIEGLERVLNTSGLFALAGAVTSSEDALQRIGETKPDLLVLDQCIGVRAALQLLGEVRGVSPDSRGVLWVNELPEADCLRCLQSGVRGIVRKTQPVSVLLACLRSVAEGNLWLEKELSQPPAGALPRRNQPKFTPREREIVQHVCRGLKNRQIAEALDITPGTVKVHLMHVFEKAGVRDRFELAMQGEKLLGVGEADAAPRAAAGQPA